MSNMPAEADTNETKALIAYLKDPDHTYILRFIQEVEMTPYELERYFHPLEEMKGAEELYDIFTREHYDWHNVDWEVVADACTDE